MKNYFGGVCVFSSFLLSGCVNLHPDYPARWPTLLKGQDCLSINGRYVNEGERVTPENELRYTYLAPLLFNEPNNSVLKGSGFNEAIIPGKYVDEVEINISNDSVIEVTAWKNQDKYRTIKYSKQDYLCSNGVIELSKVEHGVDHGIAGAALVTARLYKSADGSLIVKESAVTVGIFMIIPLGGNMDAWSRFKLMEAK